VEVMVHPGLDAAGNLVDIGSGRTLECAIEMLRDSGKYEPPEPR
jgi:hypothetical protein